VTEHRLTISVFFIKAAGWWNEVSSPLCGAVVITKKMKARPAKIFLFLYATAIHLQSFNNSQALSRWDVDEAQ
jgi:hypothetical protein